MDRFQDLLGEQSVGFDDLSLLGREGVLLEKDVVLYSNLADVVDQARQADKLYLLRWEAALPGDGRGVCGNPPSVAEGIGVPGIEGRS